MKEKSILIIGGGIGGLTSAIALGQRGFNVEVIEKDPNWAVYGVGIIQQANAVRAVVQLGIIDDYIDAGFGFDFVEVYKPDGERAARIPVRPLVDNYPANVGIGRPALHRVLGNRAKAAGATVRLGVTAVELEDSGSSVSASFSDGTQGNYDIVIGADGVYSTTRSMIFPEAAEPRFVGQSVWRYNFPKPAELDALRTYEGRVTCGLVPLSDELMYMFITTPEPGNPRYEHDQLAEAMRSKLVGAPPGIVEYAAQIMDNDAVVYKPLDAYFMEGDWYKGRVILIGDAAHATTPHLGQGAGMAIEDSLVLADELEEASTIEDAFRGFMKRRYKRCEYVVNSSLAICRAQLGQGPPVNQAQATAEMMQVVAQPI
jgi:2-polyprenyl-6-methoxyphenol hydroxylase-like FAD-dependent oxidoreductase